MRYKSLRFLAPVLLAASAVLSACGGDDVAAGPTNSATGGAGAANLCPAPDSELAAAARQEGTVVMTGTLSGKVVEPILPPAFKEKYGVTLSYVSMGGAQLVAKLQQERAAGIYSLDVWTGGASTSVQTMHPNGWYGSLKSALDPKLLEDDLWLLGKPAWADPEKDKLLLLSTYVNAAILVNTNLVKDGEIKTWQDLLDPKWAGKISIDDPRQPGGGQDLVGAFKASVGEEFIKKLYSDQKPVYNRDWRIEADGVARGQYAIGVSIDTSSMFSAVNDGLPVKVILPEGADKPLTAGAGWMAMMDRPPHPNAAKLLANWLACTEGNKAFNDAAFTPSTLKDVAPPKDLPAILVPKSEDKYFDGNDWEWIKTGKSAIRPYMQELVK